MYILYKQEKRAETVDTYIVCASRDRNNLEELLLSLLEEVYEREAEWADRENYQTTKESLWKHCIYLMKNYNIVYTLEV